MKSSSKTHKFNLILFRPIDSSRILNMLVGMDSESDPTIHYLKTQTQNKILTTTGSTRFGDPKRILLHQMRI
jgi:hypothetical protein